MSNTKEKPAYDSRAPRSSFRELIQFNIVPNSSSGGSPSAIQSSPNADGYNRNLPTPELISSSGLSMNTPDFVKNVNDMSGISPSNASSTSNSNNNTTPNSAHSTSSNNGSFSLTPNGMGFNFSATPPAISSNKSESKSNSEDEHDKSNNVQNTNKSQNEGGQQYQQYHPQAFNAMPQNHSSQGNAHHNMYDPNGDSSNAQYSGQTHPYYAQQVMQPGGAPSKQAPNSLRSFYTSSPSTQQTTHSAAPRTSASSSNSDSDNTAIRLIEGLVDLPQAKYPGGKGNTRNPIPRQVVELDITKLPAATNTKDLLLQSEVLGFDKRVNGMVPIGILSPLQPFEKTADGRYISCYDNCILRFSSHSHGQKLALRWTLFSEGKRVCSIDSSTFQTITERGIKKQNMRMAERSGKNNSKIAFKNSSKLEKKRKMKKWTLHEVKVFVDAVEKHGQNWAEILGTKGIDSCRTEQTLQKKYKQLLDC